MQIVPIATFPDRNCAQKFGQDVIGTFFSVAWYDSFG